MTTRVTAARSALTGEWHRNETKLRVALQRFPGKQALTREVRSEEFAAVEQANANRPA